MKRHSLIFRLLWLTAAGAALPALVISLAALSVASRTLKASIEKQQTELARRIAEEVNGEVSHAQGMVALVARSSFFSAGSRVDQYEALRNLIHEDPAFQEAMFVNGAGEELLKISQHSSQPRLLHRAENLREAFLGAPFFSGNRYPTILIGEPIRSFSNPSRSGAVLAKMSFTRLGTLMQQAEVGPRGTAFVVDNRGMLLAHPNERLVFAHTHLASQPVVRDWFSQTLQPTGLHEYVDDSGTAQIGVAYPIPLLKSAVVVEQPKADVFAPLEHMRNEFIFWTLLSVILFVSLGVAVAWRILQPLRQLQAAAEKVGRGERDIKLNIHTHDELEDLGKTFEAMARSLEELERMRRDLISMIVHDLKMPLSTILPSLDCLLGGDAGPLGSDQSHFVQMARRSSQEMLMLIQNLLDVAKMEEGQMRLHKELFVASDWAENIVSSFQPVAKSGKKRVDLNLAKDLPVVEGDIVLLGRVLGNLISNALRHTSTGTGEVAVSLYQDGSRMAVQVRDNGEGIPPEDQERIFDKFVQGSGHRLTVRSGTGLGLTFCNMVVEAHGGRITVYSQPGEGSLFTFHLPLKETEIPPTPAPSDVTRVIESGDTPASEPTAATPALKPT